MRIPEPSLEEPVCSVPEIREIPIRPWWMKEVTRESTNAAQEEICDHYCKWPGEYKDPDQLWNEKCDHCMIMEFLNEVIRCRTSTQA